MFLVLAGTVLAVRRRRGVKWLNPSRPNYVLRNLVIDPETLLPARGAAASLGTP